MFDPYPKNSPERDRWIVSRRLPRSPVDPFHPFAFLVEKERSDIGEIVSVATIFLTNRECPWKCLMCDLWKNTLTEMVPIGAIPAQIDFALAAMERSRTEVPPLSPREERVGREPERGEFLPHILLSPTLSSAEEEREEQKSDVARTDRLEACPTARQIKLYNSGSFFDPNAIPVEDYGAIAERVRTFERVIVECHPALVNDRCLQFRDLLASDGAFDNSASLRTKPATTPPFPSPCPLPKERGIGSPYWEILSSLEGFPNLSDGSKLEVAMGLETANPEVLEKLNKRMTLELFSRAAEFLRANDIALRVFILVKPPFLDEAGGLYWAERSLDFAFKNGASVASLIPTRPGNGALDALTEQGLFSPPNLFTIERALDYGIGLNKGRVFVDLWDLERFSDCPQCFPRRAGRLRQMNLKQEILPGIACGRCRGR
jgi:uncharacterized Fe-S cluster-containing MiaB family protein